MTEAVDRISESLARLAGLSAGYLPVFLSIVVTDGAPGDASSIPTWAASPLGSYDNPAIASVDRQPALFR